MILAMSCYSSGLLEQALGAKSKVAVLRVLFDSKLGFSGSGIAKRAGMGLLAIQNSLADLEKLGLIEVERGAVEHRYRLNARHYMIAHGLQGLFEGERKMTQALVEELRVLLEGKVVSAGLFGSFARREVKAGSDIDLLVVVATLRDRERVSAILAEASISLSATYGLPVQPVIMERRQLSSKTGNVQQLLAGAERDWLSVAGLELSRLRRSLLPQTIARRKSA